MSSQSGYVYLLKNEAMPGIYKIGMTNRSVEERVKELSLSTSIPLPFDVVCSVKVENATETEGELHEEFSEFRIASNREFFKFDNENLKKVISMFASCTFDKFDNCMEEIEEMYSKFNSNEEKLFEIADRLQIPIYDENDEPIINTELLSLSETSFNRDGVMVVPIVCCEVCSIEEYKKILKRNISRQFLTEYIENIPEDNDPFKLHELLEEIKSEWR